MGLQGLAALRRLGVGYKVVLPFAALSLIVGLLVSAVASREVAQSAAGGVANLALRAEDGVSADFGAIRQRQLVDLRALTARADLGAMAAAGDRTALEAALLPVIAGQLPDPLQVSVIGSDGTELLRLRADPARPGRCLCDGGRDLAAWPHLADVLHGRPDRLGGSYPGLGRDLDGAPLLYTAGPVLTNGEITAAVLVGERLDQLLAELGGSRPLALFAPDGGLLAESPGFPGPAATLTASERARALAGSLAPGVARPGLAAYYMPWQVGETPLGYAEVLVPSGALVAGASLVTSILVAIFLGSLVLTVVVGYFVTRSITRPLAGLLRATTEVAAGRLEHRAPVYSEDELGRVASSFNHMTASLAEHGRRLAESTDETVLALAAAIDARDHYTHGHSLRVAAYSLALADVIGLERDELHALRRGCLVHDIGKIGVPDRILGKPHRLEPDEERLMREHPIIGHNMLAHLAWDAGVFAIVRHHHERWDGAGYPDALAGSEIPRLARLVAIADTLDAMTSDRPYRSAFLFGSAAAEIERGAGSQFDPDLIAGFHFARRALAALIGELNEPAEGLAAAAG